MGKINMAYPVNAAGLSVAALNSGIISFPKVLQITSQADLGVSVAVWRTLNLLNYN
jgi:hypothetical protein